MIAWTDYPIMELGDAESEPAPIRSCEIIGYDGDKYALIRVGGVQMEIKAGYLYAAPGRCGEAPLVSRKDLKELG